MVEQTPLVSVVMPVHNALPYLEESVGSVLTQSFDDFELVIFENGSTDGSGDMLRALARREPRIRLIEGSVALGRVGSSNEVVAHARGELIARMDADDISHPARLEREVEAFGTHPEAVVVGTLCEGIDSAGRRIRTRDRSRLTRRATEAPFPHGSVMFRRSTFDEVGGYRGECEGWEDLDLLQRLAAAGRALVIASALYSVRFHADSTHRSMSAQRFVDVAARKRSILTRRFPALAAATEEDDWAARALFEHEAEQLWCGGRPDLLRELSTRGLIAPELRRRPALVLWACWARLSPRSLRGAMRVWIRLRDKVAGRHVRDGEAVEWRYG